MWPFKKKEKQEVKACVNCEHCVADSSNGRKFCSVRAKTIVSLVSGKEEHIFNWKHCDKERKFRSWLWWHCGHVGRFFKDKRKYS